MEKAADRDDLGDGGLDLTTTSTSLFQLFPVGPLSPPAPSKSINPVPRPH